MAIDKTPPHVKMDERNHVEDPFLKQLSSMPGLRWKVLCLDNFQAPSETQRTDFSQVFMEDDLTKALVHGLRITRYKKLSIRFFGLKAIICCKTTNKP
jgi:hypothetical protein